MSLRSRALSPRRKVSRECRLAVTKEATCPLACTPASVRPARDTLIGSSVKLLRARSSESCTVGAFFWYWEPPKAVPWYSIRSARRRGASCRSIQFPPGRELKLPLHQLQLGHVRAVSLAGAELDDAGGAARPFRIARGQLIEDLLHHLLVVHIAQRPAAGIQVAPLAHADDALRQTAHLLGLGLRGDDLFVTEKVRDQVTEEGQAVVRGAAE